MVVDHGVAVLSKIFLAAFVVAVAIYDVRERRIPNFLVFPAVAAGLVLNGVRGWSGIGFSLAGILAGLGLLLVPYLFRVMGAGDVKFLGAIGAFVGSWGAVRVILIGLLVYPLIAIFFVIAQGKLKLTVVRFLRLLSRFLAGIIPALREIDNRLLKYDEPESTSASTPFGLSIAIGVLLALGTQFLA